MITILLSIIAGALNGDDAGWAVFWALIAFQLIFEVHP